MEKRIYDNLNNCWRDHKKDPSWYPTHKEALDWFNTFIWWSVWQWLNWWNYSNFLITLSLYKYIKKLRNYTK